ncbi:hypothetical protein CDD82_6762 [Ophiocordyceps australis]|uniref:Autophagy-related protein 17 n=1 Tax=Ophiocordyceps australis TaxID=1399860 RepID=A0A2C5YTX2_9HYPO|nr:hypothetical protein CDD82_6762 [Ophiocordyceps australis]
MAASASTCSQPSNPSSPTASPTKLPAKPAPNAPAAADAPPISIDSLVSHLLAAKRSLSSMTLVLRANQLATAARTALEEAIVSEAQTAFVHDYVLDQITLLLRVRRALHATHEWGMRDFRNLIRAMDQVHAQLASTMDTLRATEVLDELRPPGTHDDRESRRNLLDFVDETGVHAMRDSMKKSVEELQAIQQSFDADMARFETDIRNLQKVLADLHLSPNAQANMHPPQDAAMAPLELLLTIDHHAACMADLLASLSKHFDMCVTAVRTTEGAAALARRRAAEATQTGPDANTNTTPNNGGDVSISGVIAQQESHTPSLEPETAQDRAEMLRIVVQDAHEVDDVVAEIQQRLAAVEAAAAAIIPQSSSTTASPSSSSSSPTPTPTPNSPCTPKATPPSAPYTTLLAALTEMADSRLAAYIAADDEFRSRWDLEREAVVAQLRDMRATRDFYDGYATAYASFVLELERRRNVQRQVDALWQKARDATDKLLAADQEARDAFRAEVGEFLPTDLWAGAQRPARQWKLVPLDDDETEAA